MTDNGIVITNRIPAAPIMDEDDLIRRFIDHVRQSPDEDLLLAAGVYSIEYTSVDHANGKLMIVAADTTTFNRIQDKVFTIIAERNAHGDLPG
jgi:hypothetical protein